MQLAPPVSGIISIRYRQVACAPPGGIRVVVTAYNGPQRYLRITFQVGLREISVELRFKNIRPVACAW